MSSTPAAGMVVAIDAIKRFDDVTALDGVSFTVPAGAVQVVIGPPGAGKSTLLRCIGGRETLDGGEIWIDGTLIERGRIGSESREPDEAAGARQRSIAGMVDECPELFDHMTVMQNMIEGPLALSRRPRREIVAHGITLLDRTGLAEKRDSYPVELSAGERQRATIARALAMKPKLMLFDAPTATLAPDEAAEVMSVMRGLAVAGTTMVVVTQDFGFIREVASDVIVMSEGRIVERGVPDEILTAPRQVATRDLVASLLG